jgi:hypothetical protein
MAPLLLEGAEEDGTTQTDPQGIQRWVVDMLAKGTLHLLCDLEGVQVTHKI